MDDYCYYYGSEVPYPWEANYKSIKEVVISSGVTSIGDFAFSDCENLITVTIPDSVTSIGECSFDSCTSLTNITIPDSVTSIGKTAFGYCSNLTSIIIPDSVTSIGLASFGGCTGLTSITIPDGVTSIGEYEFYYCSSLTSVTIPESVTSIHYSAFYACDSLTDVYYLGTADQFELIGYTFRDGVVVHYGTNPVKILTQPGDMTEAEGNTATFSVAAQGYGLSYQWQTYSSGSWTNSSLPGYNTATLSVPVIVSRNGYKFRCVVIDSYTNTVTSNTATLSVIGFTTQPQDYIGVVGSTATFKVVALGEGLKYQWQVNKSGTWTNLIMAGSTSATFSLDATSSRNGYKLRCVVTDAYGATATSNVATLHISQASSSNAAEATTIDKDAADEKSIVKDPIGEVTHITDDRIDITNTDITEDKTIEPAIEEPEEHQDILEEKPDEIQDITTVTDEIDIAEEQPVISTETEIEVSKEQTIVTQAPQYTVNDGKVILGAGIKGDGLVYRWQCYKDGEWKDLSITGANTPELALDITEAENVGQYRCIVMDSWGNMIII